MTERDSLTINKAESDAYIDVIMDTLILLLIHHEAGRGLQPRPERLNTATIYKT